MRPFSRCGTRGEPGTTPEARPDPSTPRRLTDIQRAGTGRPGVIRFGPLAMRGSSSVCGKRPRDTQALRKEPYRDHERTADRWTLSPAGTPRSPAWFGRVTRRAEPFVWPATT